MDVIVVGVVTTAQVVARQMVEFGTGGSIVFIASMSGIVTNKVMFLDVIEHFSADFEIGLICLAYNVSKAAVRQLARNLASEWGEHGIPCNTLSPGYIMTAMTAELFKTGPKRRTN